MAADKVIDFQKEIVKRDVKLNQLRIRHEKPIHEMDSKNGFKDQRHTK